MTWPLVDLGDVCEFKYGKSLPAGRRDGGKHAVYGSNGIVGFHSTALSNGPTIVVGRKGSFGEVTYSPDSCWPIDTTYYIDSSATKTDLKWLSYRLRELGLTGLNRAAAIPGLNREDAYRQRLLLPPLDEQRRIAATLDHADALRARRRQILAHLDSLTQSVFSEMFASGSFETALAGTLMPNMRNGLSPATAGRHSAQVLTLAAVTRGIFDPSAAKQGAFAIEPPADKRVTDRDFLMCRGSGNKALVGTGTYAREDRPDLVFPDTVIAGTVDTALATLPYLEAAWRRREVRTQIESVAQTTNGTYKVNQRSLARIRVPLPPLDIQRQFANRAKLIGEECAIVASASAVDEELFTALQTRAFRGEL